VGARRELSEVQILGHSIETSGDGLRATGKNVGRNADVAGLKARSTRQECRDEQRTVPGGIVSGGRNNTPPDAG
jgi:hypothetical protein